MSTTTPLRERRRSATRQEIHHAAVALVLERGLAGVTVEEIAEAAGVSPRTFFNYFPTKRDALVTGPPAMPEPLLAQFISGQGRILDGLRELLVAYVQLVGQERHHLQRVHEVVSANPELAPLMQQRFREFETVIAEAIAHRLGQSPPTFEASVMAAVATAVLRAAVWDWWNSGDDTSLGDRLTEAFAALDRLR